MSSMSRRGGLLARFFGRDAAPTPLQTTAIEVSIYGGRHNLDVVGESHYQDALWRIVGGGNGERVHHHVVGIIVPETDNPYDPNAVSVWIDGLKVGHLPRELASAYRSGLLALMGSERKPIALQGVIAGGGVDDADRQRMLGVFLNHDPSDFGIALDNEDGHDIPAWLARLPGEPTAAIRALRSLLAGETDSLTRHEMHGALEQRLYQARDVFASALAEYDSACTAHDGEMEEIRAALLARDGRIPYLRTYHQMAIRWRKAHEWADGLRWVERGLALYSDVAADLTWPEELGVRAAHFAAKIRVEAAASERQSARAARLSPVVAVHPEELVCAGCGRAFSRPHGPGRPPRRCLDCRAAQPVEKHTET
jgi:hypothetical protein